MKEIKLLEVEPAKIEAHSMAIIEEELGEHKIPPDQLPVVLRCIHTSADFDYAKNLRFTEKAVKIGVNALKNGCTIVTDTQMAFSGINKKILARFGCQIHCFMSDPDVAEEAKSRGVTRALVCMERASALSGDVMVVIGNAPTALVQICKMAEEFKPTLVIGAPVGFVNVMESKELLCQTSLDYICPMGRKGGSNVAAAIVNALLYQGSQNQRE